MKVTMIARDAAPSQILERVRAELQSRSSDPNIHLHPTVAILGHGGPTEDADAYSAESIIAFAATSDFVLVGMSSSEKLAKEEILAAKIAMENGIPYGFVCDIFDCYKRPWFAPFRERASVLFVAVEDEVAEAKKLFPNAEVVASGNPCWEDFFDKPAAEETAALRSRYGLSPERKTILAVGGKDLMINMNFFGGVVSAVSANERSAEERSQYDHAQAPKFQVILSVHTGDPNDVSMYSLFMDDKNGGLSRVPVAIDKGTKPEKLLAITDLVVTLKSNVGIAAACQRKPVINYFTELYRKKLEDSGEWPWRPCSELGIAELVSDFEGGRKLPKLDDMIHWMLKPGGSWWSQAMLVKQEKVFPAPPEKGIAVRKICDTLEAVVAKK